MADARSERHPAVGRGSGSGSGGTQVEERRRGNFVRDSWAELKKVEWPGQNQVIQGTIVVLVACIVVGAYLYVNDIVWKHVVSKVFLGQ
jgi:preprotein translocase SecE subunit